MIPARNDRSLFRYANPPKPTTVAVTDLILVGGLSAQFARNALPKFSGEAIIYYNLACYECQSNKIESAKQYLKQAFRIDPNWRSQALEDEDLKPLWDYLGRLNKSHQLESPLLDSFEK